MKFHFWIWLNDICLDKPANRKKNVQNNQALNISSLQNSFSNSFNSSSGKFQWLIFHESYIVIRRIQKIIKFWFSWFFNWKIAIFGKNHENMIFLRNWPENSENDFMRSIYQPKLAILEEKLRKLYVMWISVNFIFT